VDDVQGWRGRETRELLSLDHEIPDYESVLAQSLVRENMLEPGLTGEGKADKMDYQQKTNSVVSSPDAS